MNPSVEELVRARLRAIRQHQGWTLDDLAERSGVGASTISRIETGGRAISLDVLIPLARELGVGVDELVASEADEDVVIRPTAVGWHGATVWSLSRPDSPMSAFKMRLEPVDHQPEPKVHPGHDWMFVLDGAVNLTLGERTILVRAGESAEFSTMTPHGFAAAGGPAEVIMLLDRDGARMHASDHQH